MHVVMLASVIDLGKYGTVCKITLLDSFSSFQFFSFSVNSKELLSNGPYASLIGLSIIKLLGTEFLINHTFQCERYSSFACPGNFDKVSKG